VYSRDTGRGNSREGGGGQRGEARTLGGLYCIALSNTRRTSAASASASSYRPASALLRTVRRSIGDVTTAA